MLWVLYALEARLLRWLTIELLVVLALYAAGSLSGLEAIVAYASCAVFITYVHFAPETWSLA